MGQTGERVSWVAARFMIPTSSVIRTAAGNRLNISTRCTEPYGSSSPCMKPGADRLFQLRSRPPGPLVSCGCFFVVRKRTHSYFPFPSVGRRRSRPFARRGRYPDEKYAVLLRETYAQLNVNPNSSAVRQKRETV